MKDLLLKSTKTMVLFAALFGIVTLNSCKDDEDPTPDGGGEELVEDGFYVQGPSTAYTGFDIKATLSPTKNEVLQEERATLLEIFTAVKAGDGFNIIQVAGSERTTWGPGADFGASATGGEEPTGIMRGTIAQTDDKFTVSEDGLYHVVIDTKTGTGAIVKVDWGVIGQSTPGGWSADTKLGAPAFDQSSMTWKTEGLTMSGGEWKFRYSNGWKVEIDSTEDLGDGEKGVKFNTNFGGAVDALEAGGNNFNLDKSGIYTVEITWTAGSGHAAMITRTGDIPPRDYSAVEVGLIGNAIPGNDWSANSFNSTPAKNGDEYTWSYNDVALETAGGFKVRTKGTWNDINVGYDANIIGGPDAGDIEGSNDTKDGGDMKVKADGTYDIVFVIDSKEETMSVSFTKK